MHLKISAAKWQPFCPGGDELNHRYDQLNWPYSPGAGWYLEKVVVRTQEPVEDAEEEKQEKPKKGKGKKGAEKEEEKEKEMRDRVWFCEVRQWFDRGFGDKQIVRTLKPSEPPEEDEENKGERFTYHYLMFKFCHELSFISYYISLEWNYWVHTGTSLSVRLSILISVRPFVTRKSWFLKVSRW